MPLTLEAVRKLGRRRLVRLSCALPSTALPFGDGVGVGVQSLKCERDGLQTKSQLPFGDFS